MALQTPSGQSTVCCSTFTRKTGLSALQLAVGQHLSQFTTPKASVTCPSKSQAWAVHLCHPQEALRGPTHHLPCQQCPKQFRSEGGAFDQCISCLLALPCEEKQKASEYNPQVILGGERKWVCGRSLKK